MMNVRAPVNSARRRAFLRAGPRVESTHENQIDVVHGGADRRRLLAGRVRGRAAATGIRCRRAGARVGAGLLVWRRVVRRPLALSLTLRSVFAPSRKRQSLASL